MTFAIERHTQPPAGAWIRPVGRKYRYCLRARKSWLPEDRAEPYPTTEFERWGLDREAMRPVRDGHHALCWISHLYMIAPGVWRDTYDFGGNARWQCCPLYYRLMDTDPVGQVGLFL